MGREEVHYMGRLVNHGEMKFHVVFLEEGAEGPISFTLY